jgi:hypothetical protein
MFRQASPLPFDSGGATNLGCAAQRAPIDPGSDAHDLVMALYGGMSKGERNPIRIRVRSAMKLQPNHRRG